MWRNIGIIMTGIIIGAAVLLGISAMMRNQGDSQRLEELVPEQIESSPESTDSAQRPRKLDPKTLEEIRTKIRQEGIRVSSQVVEVFPGIGFIIEDDQKERLFVRWTGTPPQVNKEVDILGVVKSSSDQEGFTSGGQFPEGASQIMQKRGFYLEARDVSQATPLP